jgi:hypothetical protein
MITTKPLTHFAAAFLRLSAGILAASALIPLTGCETCTRTGMTISADVKRTTISAPPGRGGRHYLEVTGSHFNPGVPMTLSFRQYPAANPALTEFKESTVTDLPGPLSPGGTFRWTKDLYQLPALNYGEDHNTDVWVTAKENTSGCFAITRFKAGRLLNPISQ